MYIGIDLGGSHIAVALINNNNIIIEKIEENFKNEEKKAIETCMIEKIKKNTEQLLVRKGINISKVTKIGIACPRNNSKRKNPQISAI